MFATCLQARQAKSGDFCRDRSLRGKELTPRALPSMPLEGIGTPPSLTTNADCASRRRDGADWGEQRADVPAADVEGAREPVRGLHLLDDLRRQTGKGALQSARPFHQEAHGSRRAVDRDWIGVKLPKR